MMEMPEHLLSDLTSSDLVICKGDANYRRLLGDRTWPFDISFDKVMSYFPTSILVLRMIKSEIGAGYSLEKMREVESMDDQWMQNGEWGSVQFYKK